MRIHLTYIGIIAGCVMLVLFLFDRLQKSKDEIRQKESIIAEKESVIQYHINENGRIVAEKVAAQASVKELAEAYPALKEELKREFDVQIKNMKAYIRNEFEARGSGVSHITNNYYDTATQQTVHKLDFDDGYLKFIAKIDSTSKAQSEYQYRDTITTVIHSQKKWFLGNETLMASSKLSNPASKVTQSTNLLVKHRDKRWNVSVGAYYDPLIQSYGVGILAGYSLIKF
jgi:hypothetical protein